MEEWTTVLQPHGIQKLPPAEAQLRQAALTLSAESAGLIGPFGMRSRKALQDHKALWARSWPKPVLEVTNNCADDLLNQEVALMVWTVSGVELFSNLEGRIACRLQEFCPYGGQDLVDFAVALLECACIILLAALAGVPGLCGSV